MEFFARGGEVATGYLTECFFSALLQNATGLGVGSPLRREEYD